MKKLLSAVTILCVMTIFMVSCSNDIIDFSDPEIETIDAFKSDGMISAAVQPINFSGYSWYVKSGTAMGPGPNNWNANNVWLEADGLHLKITPTGTTGKWDCAEIWTTSSMGFGTYEWVVEGSLDFHADVVLGLFNYLPAKTAKKAAEIDIEIAKWGVATEKNILNYSVWPPRVISGGYYWHKTFPIDKPYSSTTHKFTWSSKSVSFQSLNEMGQEISSIVYAPASPTKYIPQVPVPVRINLWVFRGQSSTLSQTEPVEVIIRSFKKY